MKTADPTIRGIRSMDVDKIESYLDIVRYQLDQYKNIKSYRIQLATNLGFHTSHISHVLGGKAHLTHEQGMALALEWKFKESYTSLFLNLISLARSESDALKNFYKNKVEADKRNLSAGVITENINHRKEVIELNFEQSFTFFSHWRYPATLAHLEIAPIVDLRDTAHQLRLNENDLVLALSALRDMGLIDKDENVGWVRLNKTYLTTNDKKLSEMFNQTIRQRGADSTDFGGTFTPIRITQIATGSRKDFLEVRRMLTEAVVMAMNIMAESETSEAMDPQVVAFCLDFFRI
ncbi:MAG: DUF4423 domain-containing protein [Proteobacteria bacterium]|nr:MAG: DUF4423 domain-containing protein [Pseudomonadota bacterium]